MYALYYLYEWNFLRTQAKMEMTLSKNNTLLVVIENGLKSRRIYCYSSYQSHAPFNDFFGIQKLSFGGRQSNVSMTIVLFISCQFHGHVRSSLDQE